MIVGCSKNASWNSRLIFLLQTSCFFDPNRKTNHFLVLFIICSDDFDSLRNNLLNSEVINVISFSLKRVKRVKRVNSSLRFSLIHADFLHILPLLLCILLIFTFSHTNTSLFLSHLLASVWLPAVSRCQQLWSLRSPARWRRCLLCPPSLHLTWPQGQLGCLRVPHTRPAVVCEMGKQSCAICHVARISLTIQS